MIKWFVYIVVLLILIPCLSSAKIGVSHYHDIGSKPPKEIAIDTTKTAKQKQQELDEKKKIKEVTKAKRQPKPEKIDDPVNQGSQNKVKPKRQRRPAGLERPPEIPRRNGN
jgi:hypothetical protein